MRRYHIKVYTEPNHKEQLKAITENLNQKNWRYTAHCLDNLKYRAIDINGLLLFIKGLKLTAEQIFEYYTSDNKSQFIKACYRIPYINGIDIILVIGEVKQIITIYYNESIDNHETLKEYLYIKG